MNTKATVVLRYSFAALFLWFGYQQIVDPGSWVGFLPEYTGYFPIPSEMLIQLNGWSEVIAAIFLLTGAYTKVFAGLLSLHLFGIALSVGGAIGVRDAILGMIGIAIILTEPDKWTLDFKAKNKMAA